jgi:ATP-dependent DNA helicase
MSREKSPNHLSESMEAEEERMRKDAEKEENEDRKRTEKWSKAGKKEQQGQFDKLMHLVEQSKVFASIMQQRMQQEETKRQQKTEAEKKKLERQEKQAEKVAVSEQRRATRNVSTGKKDAEVRIPTRGKTKEKANDGRKGSGTLKDWLKKEDINAKTGGLSVSEAVAEAAGEYDEKTTFGAQDLRSANQPVAVTGGIMRGYQLEGLYWLRSLYENGLNGILADEMGLGKTVQTISFLAFLREMKSYGPFLVVAPLSTLNNWIDEFARWTPSIKTLLYHGDRATRAELREKKLKKPGTENFPVVCTSFEICMNDRKFLSQYGWKFIIIVSVSMTNDFTNNGRTKDIV